MSTLLQTLSELLGSELTPDRIVVHRNAGPIPGPPGVPEDHVSNRGFNLQILGADGTSTHYVKCRSASSLRARHEARILTMLSGGPRTASLVPATRVIDHGDVVVMASEFQPGATLASLATSLAPGRLWALAEGALEASETIAAALATLRDDPAHRPPLEHRERVVETLAGAGLREDASTRLCARLDALPELPGLSQHGDLTSRNVLVVNGRPVILDFEAYGETCAPLFDAWSLVASVARDQGDTPWWRTRLARLVHDRAEREGLGPQDAVTLLCWYLARSAALLVWRGAPMDYARHYLLGLERVLGEGEGTEVP